jgi:Holliday junction DNA helicase RuvA
MIRFVKGILAMVGEGEVVIEKQGIGYLVSVPLSVMDALPGIGSEVMLHTYLNVREDALQLFGFLTQEDLRVFRLLITVNGIGPKAALGMMGVLSAYEIRYAVIAGDAKTIAKAPGIGAKTAGKVILELKDKFAVEELFEGTSIEESKVTAEDDSAWKGIVKDAVEALVVLGYPKADAARAVHSVELEADMTVEELLKQSLKNM